MARFERRKFLLDSGVDNNEEPEFAPIFSLKGGLKTIMKNGFSRDLFEDKKYPTGDFLS